MDRRAEAELPPLDRVRFREVTGLVPDAGHMAAKMRWLRRNALGLSGARFHQPVSYMVERLTGEFVYDRGLASTTMLYSLADRDYSPELLEAFGTALGEIPRIDDATAVAGWIGARGQQLSGLRTGTPVAVGTGDDFATPLGAGLVAPGQVACVVGTAEVVGALSTVAVLDPDGLVETHVYANDCYFVENPGWLSGGAMAWLRRLLSIDQFETLDRAAAGVQPGAAGVIFLPALSGAMAPEWIAGARGCFYGLTPAHGCGDLARAVMEGCAFAMRDVVDRLGDLAVPTESILLLGGGARSDVWAQIRADVTGLPVDVAARADTCPLGAAVLAAIAGGVQPDLARAASLVVGARRRLEPGGEASARYRVAHARYRELFDCLRPMFGA
jgi:xylulokinase